MKRENEAQEIHQKACKNCGTFFTSKRKDAKYCSCKCGNAYRQKKLRRKARLQALLSFLGLGSKASSRKEKTAQEDDNKIDYARLTFVLSFLSFLGSIGFYLGVIREVYSPVRDKQKIEQLEEQNQQLQETIYNLSEKSEQDD